MNTKLKKNKQGLVLCSHCGSFMSPIWENNGWENPEDGPRMDEVTGYKCPMCGYKE